MAQADVAGSVGQAADAAFKDFPASGDSEEPSFDEFEIRDGAKTCCELEGKLVLMMRRRRKRKRKLRRITFVFIEKLVFEPIHDRRDSGRRFLWRPLQCFRDRIYYICSAELDLG